MRNLESNQNLRIGERERSETKDLVLIFWNQVEGDSKMVSRCESTPHLTQAVIKEEHEVVITTILNLFLVKVDEKYLST